MNRLFDAMLDTLDRVTRAAIWAFGLIFAAFLAFGLWSMAVGRSESAPLPGVRARPKVDHDAEFREYLVNAVNAKTWGGDDAVYALTFGRDGAYLARGAGGSRWEGTWKYSGGVLSVSEWCVTGAVIEYRFTLKAGDDHVEGDHGPIRCKLLPEKPKR